MDGLITHEKVEAELPTMLLAFAGWPDAAEAATRALRHMVGRLEATKVASIDPEEFYDFTVVRPQTRITEGERVVTWPVNDFYAYAPEDESAGLLIYIGTEPNLKWRTFSQIIMQLAEEHSVEMVVALGALMDAVPHTREPRVTGRASSPELNQKVEWLGIGKTNYQGPTGIHSAFIDACAKKGLPHVSIWGHSPHYVNTTPNPKVSYSLLQKLRTLVEFEIDLEEMREAGEKFEGEVTKLISRQSEMRGYVKKLEQRYDKSYGPSGEIPSPGDMVRELEEFLKSQSGNGRDRSDDA